MTGLADALGFIKKREISGKVISSEANERDFSQTNPPKPSLEKGGRYGLQSASKDGNKKVPSLFKGRLGWVFGRRKAAILCSQSAPLESEGKRAAFTLAEVLITLGIIGVVAAITMPSLVANYQKKVYATKVKQTYSLISQAFSRGIVENDASQLRTSYVDNTDPNYQKNFQGIMKEIAQTYFKPYLETIDEGGNGYNYYLILKNGITLVFMPNGWTSGNNYAFTSVIIIGSTSRNIAGLYDGSRDYSKKDFVMEIIFPSDKLTFYGSGWNDADLKSRCSKNFQPYDRITCGAFLQRNNFEIPEDYPW